MRRKGARTRRGDCPVTTQRQREDSGPIKTEADIGVTSEVATSQEMLRNGSGRQELEEPSVLP